MGFFDGAAVGAALGVAVEVEATGSTGLDEVGALADGVELCWSDGLLPSDAFAAPQAAVVRSAATAPAPRAYLLQLPECLRFTFTEVPLFSRRIQSD